ncbi:DNA damage-inducible transcript 3 protein [Colius striatus]|uniref:DNA damage-inducible transcript 3 protein n=1 Tax=Colius striatus TaxID=57412 RepID=UPI002B1CFEA6|nr:DNA damage-inducible transcript 3 protein [Colius striatus]
MAAEGLPVGTPPGTLPSWELEAWYQDLQELLAAEEPFGPSPPWGAEQEQAELPPLWGTEGASGGPEGCELDATLATELLELLGPDDSGGTEAAVAQPAPAPARSSPPQLHAEEDEDEEGAAEGRGGKRRKRGSGVEAARRAAEQRVRELTAQNERLRGRIRQLSAEVQRTRAALIERMVTLRRA